MKFGEASSSGVHASHFEFNLSLVKLEKRLSFLGFFVEKEGKNVERGPLFILVFQSVGVWTSGVAKFFLLLIGQLLGDMSDTRWYRKRESFFTSLSTSLV